MASFVGRTAELDALETAGMGDGLRTCILCGNSRSGTSSILKRFCNGKRCLRISVPNGTEREMLTSFRDGISFFLGGRTDSEYSCFEDAFSAASTCVPEAQIIAFDNIAYALSRSDSFAKGLADFINGPATASGCMVIVCCSPAGAILYANSKKTSPLYNKFQTIVDVKPLGYYELSSFHPKMGFIDRFRTYLTVGGVPMYNALMNKNDYGTCIEKNFLGQYPRLCAEAEYIIKLSSVPYAECSAILGDISKCTGRPIDIANREGLSRQLCDIYLKKLESEKLIRRLTPIGNSPKKPVYVMNDPMMTFYQTVIKMNPDVVYRNSPGYVDIKNSVDQFLELSMKTVCAEYIRSNYDCQSVGAWWMRDESTSRANICAIVKDGRKKYTLISDCKFRSGKIDLEALDFLKNRAASMSDVPDDKRFILFSMSGFDKKLMKAASKENIRLVGPDDLIDIPTD